MLCLFFGVLVASVFWPWLDVWAGAVGALSTAGLFLGLRYWPSKPHQK